MRFLSPLTSRCCTVAPLKVPGWEGLEVLPYLRGRLIFAVLAARLLSQQKYNRLLVDLPAFLNHPGWLEKPLSFFPAVSLAIFKRHDDGLRALAFAPQDAAGASLYLARLQGLPWRCVGDSDVLNYPGGSIFSPLLDTGDDYRVEQLGLEEYFQPLYNQMEAAWNANSGRDFSLNRYQAGQVVKQIKAAWQPGRRVLFLCEYQLWWFVRQALQKETMAVRFIFRWRQTPGVLVVENPASAWAQGLLDDYPAVNLDFWNHLKAGAAGAFDKFQSLERILGRIISGAPEKKGKQTGGGKIIPFKRYLQKLGRVMTGLAQSPDEGPPRFSVRIIISFQQYLKNLMVSRQRLLPEPGNDLFHAAHACGGPLLQRILAGELLRYPSLHKRDQLNFILQNNGVIVFGGPGLKIGGLGQLPSLFTGRAVSPFRDSVQGLLQNEEYERRQQILDLVNQELTPKEKEELDESPKYSYVRWEVMDDYRLHAQACAQVRLLTQRRWRQFVPKRSWGAMEGGLHWKATLAALARGEGGIYIKHCKHREVKLDRMDEFTPVVLLLAPEAEIDRSSSFCVHDGNLAQRNRDLENEAFPFEQYPPPDMVFSVFGTTKANHRYLEGHVEQEDLTSLAFIYTKGIMGFERYQAITRNKPRHQCRLRPPSDPELWDFPLSLQGVAWAVKHAANQVFVAALAGWQPPAMLRSFAGKKGVKLIAVPLNTFRPEFLDRLGRIFLTSTPLKKHSRREEIVRRFIH